MNLQNKPYRTKPLHESLNRAETWPSSTYENPEVLVLSENQIKRLNYLLETLDDPDLAVVTCCRVRIKE